MYLDAVSVMILGKSEEGWHSRAASRMSAPANVNCNSSAHTHAKELVRLVVGNVEDLPPKKQSSTKQWCAAAASVAICWR